MRGAKATYESLEHLREPFLKRARDHSLLTIPSLLRRSEGQTSGEDLAQPFQSLGSRGVNNMSSKMLLSIMPPNARFFRYMVEAFERDQLPDEEKTELDQILSQNEKAVTQELELQQTRVFLYEVFRHLLVTGNCLLHIPPEGPRVFHLDSYVVARDPRGNILTIATKTGRNPDTLPKDWRALIKPGDVETGAGAGDSGKFVQIHTMVDRNGDTFVEHRELAGRMIPKSRVDWNIDEMPYLALRMQRMDSEDYGRSYIEEYAGDLTSLEGLNKAILEGAAASTKIIGLVDPGGLTDEEEIDSAPNGAIRPGRAQDVQFVQVQKHADLSVAERQIARIEQRLSNAFLLNTPRNAERVTAEEIRLVAQELDDALGGPFTLLSSELQLPLVNVTTKRLERQKRVHLFQDGKVQTAIVTGLAAIGRGHELQRLDAFVGGAIQLFGPQVLTYLNVPEYLSRRATASGIDQDGLIRSDEEVQQQQQRAQLMSLAEKSAPEALKQAGPQIASAIEQATGAA